MHVDVAICQEDANYVDACARIRNISRSELLRRILAISVRDKIVGAILDDIKWEDEKIENRIGA